MKAISGAALFVASLLFVSTVSGQMPHGQMMMGHYDTKTEVTIQGTVEKVNRMGNANMPAMGIHLTVKAGDETSEIHLGPASFVEKTMSFKEGDAIEVIGSKVMMMGRTVVMAREVKKGNDVLKLRDEHGMPLWPAMMHPSS